MRIVVGVSPDDSGADAVALGAVLARLLDASIVLAYIHPPTVDYPSMGHVDAEWAAFLQERGDATLGRATAQLDQEWQISDVQRTVMANSSVSRGLKAVGESSDASIIVVGPDSAARDGRVALGSIAHSLLHGGAMAVAVAPEGYRETAPDHLDRLVVGFRDTSESRAVLQTAADIAAGRSISVQLLTVVLRTTRIIGARVGRDPERAVMDSLAARERQAQDTVLSTAASSWHGAVVVGDTAEAAMARFTWRDSDLFVMGSSRFGALRRVLLSDTSHKLLRASTVPAIVLPRETDDLTWGDTD
jgi:nucleotide-binding universal stress UspA family protein